MIECNHLIIFMNWAYLHLAINHFPIVGVIIGTLILIPGFAFKNEGIRISGLSTILFSAILAVVAYLTGDPAEKVVEGLPGIAESLINKHEDLATISMYLVIPAGLMAAMTLYSIWKKERSVNLLLALTLTLSIISSVTLVYTGRTGGLIRHSEFRNDTQIPELSTQQSDTDKD